jgi:alkylhydroperoxidase/carboxymuconolactone decarboxylase family protein YurZ
MATQPPQISNAFRSFLVEAPKHAQAWSGAVQGLAAASSLDEKTSSLAYLAVLAALRLESGIPFHVQAAKKAGATRDEVISAVLIGLPAAGNAVTACLPAAVQSFDAE